MPGADKLQRMLPRPVFRAIYRGYRAAALPPRALLPWVAPGGPALLEARWRLLLRRAPVMDAEEHCRRVGLKDIEEVIDCTLCGDRRVQPLFNPRGAAKPWSYHVVRCPTCGLLYRQPGIKPERLGELYEGRYDKFLVGHYGKGRQRRYLLTLDAVSPLLDAGGGRRLLDFGCGAGQFLDIAHDRGFDPYGVDLSQASIEHARTKPSGANAYFGSPMEVPEIAAGGFDVITMWSVLAHLPRPVEDITMLRGLLAPGGVLLIFTVNANSLLLRATLDSWNGFTENHLKMFSPQTLPLLLRKAGFEAVALPPFYGDTVEAGTTRLRPGGQRRLRRNVERGGNRGNMMRAVAFTDRGTVPAQLAGCTVDL